MHLVRHYAERIAPEFLPHLIVEDGLDTAREIWTNKFCSLKGKKLPPSLRHHLPHPLPLGLSGISGQCLCTIFAIYRLCSLWSKAKGGPEQKKTERRMPTRLPAPRRWHDCDATGRVAPARSMASCPHNTPAPGARHRSIANYCWECRGRRPHAHCTPLTRCWFNAGPPSTTLPQPWTNIWSTSATHLFVAK